MIPMEMIHKGTLKQQDSRESSLYCMECFKTTVIHPQRGGGGAGGDGEEGTKCPGCLGQRSSGEWVGDRLPHHRFILQSGPSPGLQGNRSSASFLCLSCPFPLPPLSLHVSVNGERASVPGLSVNIFPIHRLRN